ncbi:MAG: hypothetical protein QOH96_3195, partial [Blastocatellia bacterium]|nr:hypothetical protein [Blastocatellia bacterium]
MTSKDVNAGAVRNSAAFDRMRTVVTLSPSRLTASILALIVVSASFSFHSFAQDSSKRSLDKVTSRADFDSIARTYDPNTPYALPHVLFV